MRRRIGAAVLATVLMSCASKPDPGQAVDLSSGAAVPVDVAVLHLPAAVDRRISVSGIPRAREGNCPGVQPLSRKDWMLTGKTGCLWVSGYTEDVRLLDLRPGMSKSPVTVVGRLQRTDRGVYVLVVDPR